ncbi:hypothetical protein MSUIS_06700 [Mycoplasma suis KI3806]|uniref:Uncharacterized protein n=1 Tax=Mycoplasma suis (strain KI_3806) TaxID=708248 RepID=F0V282_MYCS3|nr:hypothetical protein [Mycoplasma suis]CBZ40763.1 hypothetical protein MSUIS_06700 [Mycoplasma suis KI3806]
MISGIAAKALILVVGLGAGLGAGEIGSMYNYDETISDYQKGTKIFDKVQLSSISQELGKGILVGKDKTNFGGWEEKTRVGGNAKGGGKVGENDVDIIFTQNRLIKTDETNGSNTSQNGKNFGKTQKGVSNRHICILLGKELVKGIKEANTEQKAEHISGTNGDTCWNYSWWVSKQKQDGSWYDISAKGNNGSRVFLDSTLDPNLGVLEINPQNNQVIKALGRKGWILGLKVSDPKKWCHVHHDPQKDQWRGNSLKIAGNVRNKENMKKIGFDFLRQSVMVWYEKEGTMSTGWGDKNAQLNNGRGKKYMQVINCYQA